MAFEALLTEPSVLANRLRISTEAVQLARSSDVIDLHLDTFIPIRLFGYDVRDRHGTGLTRGWFFGHVDIPRAFDAGLSGGMWSITTNPLRTAEGRWRVFQRNLKKIRKVVDGSLGHLTLVKNVAEYRDARARRIHACFLSVQGGNCFDAAPNGIADLPPGLLTRVTLIHLTNSALGATSTPILSSLRRDKGLTAKGRELVEQLNEHRVFVDLAHLHPCTFWDAVEAHDKTQPLISTHTGISGVTDHWRNLDDRQIKAIADTGGTIGIIFQRTFLKSATGATDGRLIVEHMNHIISVAGEDFISVGSDYDGAIIPPTDFKSGDSYPCLVQHMLNDGWSEERIKKALGGNFLRALSLLRPDREGTKGEA